MGIIVTNDEHYKNIANTIREKTATENAYTPAEMASGVNDVYEAGKKAEYDAFWDVFQSNGKRTNYQCAFDYLTWTNAIFKPKYQIKPTNAMQMFYRNTNLSGEIESIINIDWSNCTDFTQACQNLSKVTRLGVLDLRKATNLTNAFIYMTELVTIDKIIVDESLPSTLHFTNDSKLENVIIEGELVKNVSAGACPLTVESMKSIISHLKDFSTEAPFTYTVTFSSTCLTLLDAEGNTSPNGNTWRDYAADKGWNIG